MTRAARLPLALGALAALAIAAPIVPAPAQEAGNGKRKGEDKKDKKDKEKEGAQSPLESSDARAVVDKLKKHLESEAFTDAFEDVKELLEKHHDKLLDTGEGQLRLAGPALRRILAPLPKAGRTALRKIAAEELPKRLAAARGEGAAALEAFADRWFPLDEAGEALVLAGDLAFESGGAIAAAVDWLDVLDFHPSAGARSAAARRLVGALPSLGDPAVAEWLADKIDEAADLEGQDGLADAARAKVAELEKKLDLTKIALSVNGSGIVERLQDAVPPDAEPEIRFDMPKFPKEADPLKIEKDDPNVWPPPAPSGVRWILAGPCWAKDILVVHFGKGLHAYKTNADATGRQHWSYGKYIETYLGKLPGDRQKSLPAVPFLGRYGLSVTGRTLYATVQGSDDDQDPETKSALPIGKLLALELETKETLIELTPKTTKVSFHGPPIARGDRIYCGATTPGAPNETHLVALDRDGEIVWKRALAASDAINPQVQAWQNFAPRALACPAFTFAFGAVIAVSNNGAVIALDARDGRLLWARTYAHEEPPSPQNEWQNRGRTYVKLLRRAYTPPLVIGAHAFVLPTDASRSSYVRLVDGRELKSRSRSVEGEELDTVFGVAQGMILLAGETHVAGYKLRPRGEPREGWDQRVRGRAIGRGVLTPDYIYLPFVRSDGGADPKPNAGAGGKQGKRGDAQAIDKKWKGGIYAFDVRTGERTLVHRFTDPKKEAGDLVLGAGRFFAVGAGRALAWPKAEPEEEDKK